MAMEDMSKFLDELDGNEQAKALLETSAADLDDEEGFKSLPRWRVRPGTT